jgi:hypothetical protein
MDDNLNEVGSDRDHLIRIIDEQTMRIEILEHEVHEFNINTTTLPILYSVIEDQSKQITELKLELELKKQLICTFDDKNEQKINDQQIIIDRQKYAIDSLQRCILTDRTKMKTFVGYKCSDPIKSNGYYKRPGIPFSYFIKCNCGIQQSHSGNPYANHTLLDKPCLDGKLITQCYNDKSTYFEFTIQKFYIACYLGHSDSVKFMITNTIDKFDCVRYYDSPMQTRKESYWEVQGDINCAIYYANLSSDKATIALIKQERDHFQSIIK